MSLFGAQQGMNGKFLVLVLFENDMRAMSGTAKQVFFLFCIVISFL